MPHWRIPTAKRQFTLLLLLLGAALEAKQFAFLKTTVPGTAGAMIEDDEGALWLGADEGLFRFDGTRIRQIDLGLGTKPAVIRSLSKSQDGAIWATSLGGLFRIRMIGTEPVVTRERDGFGIGADIHGSYVAHVEGDGNGGSLALGVYQDGKLSMVRYDAIHFTGPPRFAADGSLHGACGDFACEIPAAAVEKAARGQAPEPLRLPFPIKNLGRVAVLKDASGCLWFRNNARAGYRCQSDKVFQLLPPDLAEISAINYLFLAPDNRIWIPSEAGLVTYGRPGDFQSISTVNGMPRLVQTVYQTREGSIWLATPGALWRLIPPERLELWTDRDGVSIFPSTIVRGGNGSLLIGGAGGLLRLSADRARWEPFSDQKEMRSVPAIAPLPTGNTLVASAFSGVLELDRNGAILRRTLPNLTRFADYNPAIDGPNQLWTSGHATRKLQFGPAGLRYLPSPATLPARDGSSFARDQRGRLWHCTPQGLKRLDPGATAWRTWSTTDGLLSNHCRDIAVSPSGDTLWFMYQTDAMSRLDFSRGDTPTFTHFNNNANLHFEFFVKYDSRGWLWHGGEGLRVAALKGASPVDWLQLGDDDGVTAPRDDHYQSLFIDSDNSLWITDANTVRHYTPPLDLFAKKQPAAFLSAAPPRELKKGAPAKFDFGSLFFQLRRQLRFRYRLQPTQSWTETEQTTVTLQNLPPGDHHFELSARVAPLGDWTPPVSHPFTVVAPLWQTPAFLATTGGLALAAVALFWTLSRRKRRAYLQQKEAFLDALDSDRPPTDPHIERLLRLSKTPTHLPEISPWHSAAAQREMPSLIDGRFTVESVVASGGFATVYLARDRSRQGAATAIKLFHLSDHEREWMLKRFSQEIESLKRIHHPGVVPFLAAGDTPHGEPFLAMDFVEGHTLRRLLADGALPLPRAAHLTRQLGSALSAIHQAGVYHRDIKPENLMIAPGDHLVVIDFSIAIARDPRTTQHALSRAAGSFFYMAPEQVFGFATPATDIYSFALVVFEMLTGKRAGDLGLGATSGSLPAEISKAVAELCPDLPPAELLASALVVEVKNRPQDAHHFAARLAAWLMS